MKIGFDVDGVIVDFNTGFIDRVIRETGRDLFPPRPFAIPCWDYPQYYGYTPEEIDAIWGRIKADPFFWLNLPKYADTYDSLLAIARRIVRHDDVYFITARPGIEAKEQTERWLFRYWPNVQVPNLTVLISSQKGRCAKALDLDVYIDDRDKNVLDVNACRGSLTRTFLVDRPWNRTLDKQPGHHGIIRTSSVSEMLSLFEPVVAFAA